MPDPNVLRDDDPFDFEIAGAQTRRVGAPAGGEELGASVYVLQPGAAATPYHCHHGNEELLVVLEGTPSVRTPQGVRALEPGAVLAFPKGPEGAHRVLNASEAPARFLVVSTQRFPEVAEHLDTGTTMAMLAPGEGRIYPDGTDAPFGELYADAMRIGVDRDAGAAEA